MFGEERGGLRVSQSKLLGDAYESYAFLGLNKIESREFFSSRNKKIRYVRTQKYVRTEKSRDVAKSYEFNLWVIDLMKKGDLDWMPLRV